MDEDEVEEIRDDAKRLFRSPGLPVFLQDVAHGARDDRRVRFRFRPLEEWNEFETHLAAGEGKSLDDEDIRHERFKGTKKALAAQRSELIAERPVVGIDKLAEGGVARPDWRQLDELDLGLGEARDRRPPADDSYVDLGLAQCRCDVADPRQMANAEKMLDIDERLHEEPRAAPNSLTS